MPQKLVCRNPDLSQLRADGLDISIGKSNYLLIRDAPYVNAAKQIKRGIIASALDLAGENTVPPKSHVVFFVGEPPVMNTALRCPELAQTQTKPWARGSYPTTRSLESQQRDPRPASTRITTKRLKRTSQ